MLANYYMHWHGPFIWNSHGLLTLYKLFLVLSLLLIGALFEDDFIAVRFGYD
jgi:hypothetical protein